jgi:hypothetical protein
MKANACVGRFYRIVRSLNNKKISRDEAATDFPKKCATRRRDESRKETNAAVRFHRSF